LKRAFRRNTLIKQALWSISGAGKRENQAAKPRNFHHISRVHRWVPEWIR
jgi:hypothetical protein